MGGREQCIDTSFERRRVDCRVVLLCVRWYLDSKLSLRDVAQVAAERGLTLAHTTLMRWAWRCAPGIERGSTRSSVSTARSWRVEHTINVLLSMMALAWLQHQRLLQATRSEEKIRPGSAGTAPAAVAAGSTVRNHRSALPRHPRALPEPRRHRGHVPA